MSVTSVNAATNGTSTTVGVGIDGLKGDDFMKILMRQLQYQDPFKPMGNEEMINQIARIRELEMNSKLTDKLSNLGDQERFGAAAAMIGKYVRGAVQDANGNTYPMEGTVTGVRFSQKGEVLLELETGDLLPLIALARVANSRADMRDVS
ncbi:MAG TPA: flagellar hook capping FlgD N-terminal domain-containing protein [Phycisphaerae bacterium]|nr:flagellar hook capping FlgD N-terminal domain-containing protein [Phycisphaerae bacterium]